MTPQNALASLIPNTTSWHEAVLHSHQKIELPTCTHALENPVQTKEIFPARSMNRSKLQNPANINSFFMAIVGLL